MHLRLIAVAHSTHLTETVLCIPLSSAVPAAPIHLQSELLIYFRVCSYVTFRDYPGVFSRCSLYSP